MIGHASRTGAAGAMQPSSPSCLSCGCAARNGPRPDASARPMIPLPLPTVQKSSNTLWPDRAMTHRRVGVGARAKVGLVTVSTGTIPSAAPATNSDGFGGSATVVVVAPALVELADRPLSAP